MDSNKTKLAKSDVFCPNCSAKNKIEQNFCRFCGFNLQETKKSLAAQLSVNKNASRFKQLKSIKKLTDFASVALAIIVSTGIIFTVYAILNNMILSGRRVLLGLFLIYMIFQFVIRQIRRINRRKIMEDEAKTNPLTSETETRETAKLLEEKPFETARSVTENTTGLLYAEQKTKKFE